MRSPWFATMLGLVMGATGCGTPDAVQNPHLASRIGKTCVVQFRRGDALGAGRDLPVGPDVGSINGSEVNLKGRLAEASEEWISLVDDTGYTYCIPHSAILSVKFAAEPSP